MAYLAPTLSRAFAAPLATRPRRIGMWTVVGGLLAAVAALRVTFAAAGVPPAPSTAAALDVAVVAALALAYRLGVHRVRPPVDGPLRAVGLAAASFGGLAALTAVTGALTRGRLDPFTFLPLDAPTALAGSAIGVVQGLAVIAALVALRPLLLYARRPAVVGAWRVALAAAALAALAAAGTPIASRPPVLSQGLHVVAVLAGTGLALRQGALSMLAGRDRWRGAGMVLLLLGSVVAEQVVRQAGPGVLAVGSGRAPLFADGPAGATDVTVPLGAVLGASGESVVALGANLTAIFAVAALLALLVGLPGTLSPAQRAGERRALRALTAFSGQMLDVPALAQSIARGPVEAGLADGAWLALSDPASGSLVPHVVAAEGWSVEGATAAADTPALVRDATDGPLVLPRAAADHRVHSRPGQGVGSLAVVPLAAGTRAGALVAVRRSAEAFEADDLAALETFAGQAGLALSHAGLFAEALDRERLAREIALARSVQIRLFPQILPTVDGLDLAAAEQPAREIGGDYYDAVRLGDTCVGLLVADVSGKGAAAAFYMAELKGVVQAASRLTRAPGELLAQANDALASSLARGAFVSAAYAVVDADAGTVTVGRAGHCPPILARDSGRADGGTWLLRPAGLAVGLDREGPAFRRILREHEVHLAAGDVLVLYTDGLVEGRNPAGEEYGYERLAAAVAAHRHLPATALRDALLAAHHDWAAGADPADDLSLVVMAWRGRAGVPEPPPAATLPPVTDRPAFP